MELQLSTRTDAPFEIIEVGGEIDVYTAPRLREAIVEAVDAGHLRLIVDDVIRGVKGLVGDRCRRTPPVTHARPGAETSAPMGPVGIMSRRRSSTNTSTTAASPSASTRMAMASAKESPAGADAWPVLLCCSRPDIVSCDMGAASLSRAGC